MKYTWPASYIAVVLLGMSALLFPQAMASETDFPRQRGAVSIDVTPQPALDMDVVTLPGPTPLEVILAEDITPQEMNLAYERLVSFNLRGSEGLGYDRNFLDRMIAHHQAAIAIAEEALENAWSAGTQEAARRIVEHSRSEIPALQAKRNELFPR